MLVDSVDHVLNADSDEPLDTGYPITGGNPMRMNKDLRNFLARCRRYEPKDSVGNSLGVVIYAERPDDGCIRT